jgi:hypothetical protein
MAGEASITLQSRYLLVNVQGDALPPEEIKLAISTAIKQATKSNLNIVVLREVFSKQPATAIDFFDCALFLTEAVRQFEYRNKIALVFPQEMHYKKLDFFTDASSNRGINIKLFSTKEEAHKWLGIDSD